MAISQRTRWRCTRHGASRRDDVLLHALPVFHVHGLFVALHCALLSGAPMIWLPKFTDAEVLAGLQRATVMMGVPTFYTRLLANPAFTQGQRAERARCSSPARRRCCHPLSRNSSSGPASASLNVMA